ncbi:MAG TPA: c-type cytochrome [Vicinamibacterales bacterium]|nr:c-type cytochrome [Vicinamibacterales bacterium]
MRSVAAVAVGLVAIVSLRAQQPSAPPREPQWAFPAINGQLPPEEPGPKSLAGSSKSYTPQQIDDLSNPPDWFPDEHPAPPALVQKGHGAALACGACHLMSGEGHPESAGLTGYTAAYVIQQMADFKSGARKDAARMNAIAKDVSDEESRQVAEWFAALKPRAWTKVTEAAMVPKSFVGQGRMRFVDPSGGMEPIGNRIITVPQDQARARSRDPHTGFIAYVPPGSIAKGKALVETGGNGRTVACSICHGDALQGLGNVPRLAGVHPIYMARQLYLFKDGTRNGVDAQLMKKPVAKLTDDDILNVSAYLASLSR